MNKKNIAQKVMKILVVICNIIVLGLLAIDIIRSDVPSEDYFSWTFVVLLSSAAFCTLAVVFMPQVKWFFRFAGKTVRGAGRLVRRNVIPLAIIIGAGLICLIATILILGRDIPPPDTSDLVLERPEVSDEGNAFYWFVRAAEAKLWPAGGRKAYDNYRYPEITDEPPDMALVVKTFEMNEAVFAKIARGLQQEVCLTPEMTYEDFKSGPLPYLAEWRSMARFMAARVSFERENGRYEEAVDVTITLLEYGDMITNEATTIIENLVGQAILAIGLAETVDLVRDEGISQEQLVTVSRALERIRPLEQGFVRSLKGEFELGGKLLEGIERGKDISDLTLDPPLAPGFLDFLMELNRYTGYFMQPNRTQNIRANILRIVIENAGRSYAEIELEGLPKYYQSDGAAMIMDIIKLLPRPNSLGRLLVLWGSPAYKRMLALKLRAEAHISAVQLITALHTYKKANGEVPERLDELVPYYLDAVPRDPFDGELFKYNPSLDVVYSVGENLEDNSGRAVLFERCIWSGEDMAFVAGVNVESFHQEAKKAIREEEDIELRPSAAKNLRDQALLGNLAMEHPFDGNREAAAMVLSDQEVLEMVAAEDESDDVRLAAVRNLKRQELLEQIAVEDESPKVRAAAVRKLKDQDLVEKIVREDASSSVRRIAVRNLTNQEFLEKLALGDQDVALRRAAVGNLVDQTLLETIALEESEKWIRWAAVFNLTDQEVIVKVALEDPEWEVRQGAVLQLSDVEILNQIAKADKELSVRQAARARQSAVEP